LSSQPVLTVPNLTKSYGDFKALDSVSFTVDKGRVYGYLDPNGARKTAIMRAVGGPLRPENFFLTGAKCAHKLRIKNLK
jgi:ABC-2 type transport system ATP-binding protein